MTLAFNCKRLQNVVALDQLVLAGPDETEFHLV